MAIGERLTKAGAVVALVVLVVAPLVDRIVFPEADLPPSAYPTVGQVFQSETEGFTQRVVRIDDEFIWSELILHPHAPGPPAHVHTTFAERFIVAEGEVSMQVDGETKVLRAGEEFLVEPGVAHRPFNATGTEAIVLGPLTPDYALPRDFGVFLTQPTASLMSPRPTVVCHEPCCKCRVSAHATTHGSAVRQCSCSERYIG